MAVLGALPHYYLFGATFLAVDGRRASTILFELCSRSGGDARELMTVGCKPTILAAVSLLLERGPLPFLQ